jgi:hypothetical protein
MIGPDNYSVRDAYALHAIGQECPTIFLADRHHEVGAPERQQLLAAHGAVGEATGSRIFAIHEQHIVVGDYHFLSDAPSHSSNSFRKKRVLYEKNVRPGHSLPKKSIEGSVMRKASILL